MATVKGAEHKAYTNQVYRKGRRRATVKRADTEAIYIYTSRVPQMEGKGDNKESSYRGYINQ